MDKLEIHLLGEVKIFWNEKNITENLSTKAIAILCVLSITPEKSCSRDKLISYFWQSSKDNAAKYNLRYTLWSMRKILKTNEENTESIIINIKDKCKINSKVEVITDVYEVNHVLEFLNEENKEKYIEKLEWARKILSGEFMERVFFKSCHEFNDWIFYMREKFQRAYLDVLHKLSQAYSMGENYLKSIEILEGMLRLNPLQEELYVEIIEVYLKTGNRKAALLQYEKCCDILRDELNVSPMESTKKIYKKIIESEKTSYYIKEVETKITRDEHVRILFTEKENFENLKKKFFCEEEYFYTKCYPIKEVDYYWMSEFIEAIINKKEICALNNIPEMIRESLSIIQIELFPINHSYQMRGGSREGERIRIFSAMNYLLKTLNKKTIIFIENFQWIDDVSFEFFKYFVLKCKNFKGLFVLSGNYKDKRFEELEEFITIEKM
ncbi:MAG: hypothetical protein N4A62_09315 [Marinisporobacter sp.]|jgi:DNA-binding SARP family transcriptional activator|nr:hypothetical protein [Marinisporobacter sp.]